MEIGRVVGLTSLTNYKFVVKRGKEAHARRGEFVSVEEAVSGREVLGVVRDIQITNELLPEEFSRDLRFEEELMLAEGELPVASVKVLGCETGGSLEMPSYGIRPGSVVKLASDETLAKLLEQQGGAFMGTLASRRGVPIHLSINDIVSRHIAILAMTGAGKSHTATVLIEEILKRRGSVVVFDPHGEYANLRPMDSEFKAFGLREGVERVKIDASALATADYATLLPDMSDVQRDLLDEVLSLIRGFYQKFDLELVLDFLSALQRLKAGQVLEEDYFPRREMKELAGKIAPTTLGALMRKLERLRRMGVFSSEGLPVEALVSSNQLTVIDLSEADTTLASVVVAAISKQIFEARKAYVSFGRGAVVPTLLVVEEAHNFVPREEQDLPSKSVLKQIAREGRKFGVGLCIISQRPSKLDADVLSQCNTQIVMRIINPLDQEYIRQSVESVTEDMIKDLPALTRGEAIITGTAIRFPVWVKVRQKVLETRGEEVDALREWLRRAEVS